MYRLLLIAKNNLLKRKSNTIVLACLTGLAALLLYISASVLSNTGQVLNRAYEEANTADYEFISGSKEKEAIQKIFSDQEEVASFESNDCLYVMGAKYRGENQKKENDYIFHLSAIEEDRRISKIIMREEGEIKKNSIILPFYLKSDSSFQIGEDFYLTLGEHTYPFEIMGFTEDPLCATPMSISIFKCYITREYMDEITEKEKALTDSLAQEYKAKLKKGVSSVDFDQKVSALLTSQIPDLAGGMNLSLNWETMKSGGVMMSNIGMGIVLVFAVLLILIALIIVRCSIRNFIEDNMKNIGILKAMGYTSGQLMMASVMELLCITVTGILLGLLLGYCSSGLVGGLEASLIGLSWNREFDGISAALTALVILSIVLAVTLLTCRTYRKIAVLSALRGGIHTHNFRRNRIKLDKTCLPLSSAMSIQGILREKRKYFAIFFIVALLSLASGVGLSLYLNFGQENEIILKLSGAETGTGIISGSIVQEAGEEMAGWEGMEKVLLYASSNIKLSRGGKETTLACDFWDRPEALENEMLVEGRLPQLDNEIVITTLISDMLGAKTGDVIYAEGNGEQKDYIVVGIDQKVNNMGRKAIMNFDGASRLNGSVDPSQIYFYARKGHAYQEFADRITKLYPEYSIADSANMVETFASGVTFTMKMLCVVFIVITVFVVSLVIILLIQSRIVKERRNYGIFKALGFTTRQLMAQTILSNIPVIFAGTAAGAVCSIFLAGPLIVACLSFCGIRKCEMTIDPAYLVLIVIGITLTALTVAALSSYKIRKIEPMKLLNEE